MAFEKHDEQVTDKEQETGDTSHAAPASHKPLLYGFQALKRKTPSGWGIERMHPPSFGNPRKTESVSLIFKGPGQQEAELSHNPTLLLIEKGLLANKKALKH